MNQFSRPNALNVADIITCTEVEGPGKRFCIWVQGCPLRCPGCCNPLMQEFREETWTSVEDLADQIRSAKDLYGIEGVTFVGGEPLSQIPAVGFLCEKIQEMDLGVMVFTGNQYKTLQKRVQEGEEALDHLLQHVDLLIDGPFLQDRLSEDRCFVGSDNQGIRFLSDRYARYDGFWPSGDGAIEIRFDGENIIINGHPRPTIG